MTSDQTTCTCDQTTCTCDQTTCTCDQITCTCDQITCTCVLSKLCTCTYIWKWDSHIVYMYFEIKSFKVFPLYEGYFK